MITFQLYCQFVSILFMFTGMGLFMYCIVMRINIWTLNDYSSPILYLVLGLMFTIAGLVKKYEHLIKGEIKSDR